MARVIERQITIDAPAEKVFSYLADLTRHEEWAAHPLRIQQTSEGPVGPGTTFTSVGRQFGRDNEDKIIVTEIVPSEKIVFESEGRAGRFRHHFLLQEEDGGTRLTKGVELVKLSLLLRLLTPIVAVFRVTARGFDGDLERIKTKLEGGTS